MIRQILNRASHAITLVNNQIGALTNATQTKTCLPCLKELALSVFKGEKSKFSHFQELFNVYVHNHKDLDNVAKFTYLLDSQEGQPLRVVQALSVLAVNYTMALNLLTKYYGNQHQMLIVLHQWLANIFVPKFKNIKLSELRIEFTVLIEQIKCLSGSTLDQGMLLRLINQKLSQGHVYQKVVNYLSKCDYSLDELFEALNFLIRYLEDDALQNGGELSQPKESSGSRSASCPFCNSGHPAFSCVKHPDVTSKKNQLILTRKCFNCLALGHTSKQCGSKCNCKLCGGRHHCLVCDSNDQKSSTNSSPTPHSSFQQSYI
ncbi:uncharacterized protein LOC135218801 [Macrobrachium nipponense]|uniref:uncharacterized protein LOC135218801 n=1 Tax=Macrobrachium nipponense TaxID=159736 RepID=UPI0030C87E02